MFWHILKKDLNRKRTMNIILFLFITMASMFLASSVNNLIIISGSVDAYLEKANRPDYLAFGYLQQDEDPIAHFLKTCDYVTKYECQDGLVISESDIQVKSQGNYEMFEASSTPILQKNNSQYNKVFDENGKEFTLKDGEAALPLLDADTNKVSVGDYIKITIGDITREFKIAYVTRDAVFGSSMMGTKRIMVSDSDYEAFHPEDQPAIERIYNIKLTDDDAFEKEFRKNDFNVLSSFKGTLINKCYIFEMLVAAVLIIVSICLILISFLILRFTIVFTLQEDYKEIGIMKALGMKNKGIRELYLVKYLAISIVGSALGMILSFPFGTLLLKNSSKSILMDDVAMNGAVNLICAVLIVIIVLVFCYGSMNKLKKFSPMEAIRSGSNGERFQRKSPFQLGKMKTMTTPWFLSIQNICSTPKRFLVLLLTYIIGVILIILPLNTANTLQGKDLYHLFGYASADVFISPDDLMDVLQLEDQDKVEEWVDDYEEMFRSEGIPVSLFCDCGLNIKYYSSDINDKFQIVTMQCYHHDGSGFEILEGEMPLLSNEIMLTEISANKMNVGIGDTVYAELSGKTYDFIVTGFYQTMMNFGEGARLSPEFEISPHSFAYLGALQGRFDLGVDHEQMMERLQQLHPDYSVDSPQAYMDRMIGGISSQVGELKNFIVLVVVCINILVTILMMKTLLTKEHAEIAMLKSIGFTNRTIRRWQTIRVGIIIVGAAVIGIGLSIFLGPLSIGKIFAYMGANHIKMIINPWEVYVLYPCIMMLSTVLTAYLCSAEVKHVDLREVNNLE